MRGRRALPVAATLGFVALLLTPARAAAQLSIIQTGVTGITTLAGDVAYDPDRDFFLFVSPTGPSGQFISGSGNLAYPPFAIDSGTEIVSMVRAVYSRDLSDGAGGAGAFLVIWASHPTFPPVLNVYVQVVGIGTGGGPSGRLVGPRRLLYTTNSINQSVLTVAGAYSPTDHVFFVAWGVNHFFNDTAGLHGDFQPMYARLDLSGQPQGAITSLKLPKESLCEGPNSIFCGRIDLVWNPAVNEFGLLYDDAALTLVRVRTDGVVLSRTSLGAGTLAHGLAASPRNSTYLAAFADTTTHTAEVDVSGAVVRTNTPLPSGVDSSQRQELDLAYSPLSHTSFLDVAGLAVEVDDHGAPISPAFPMDTWRTPAAASRSIAPEWMVTTPTGYARVRSSVTSVTYVRGDFTGDGQIDLVWQHPDTGEVRLSEMNGSQDVGVIPVNGGTYWQVLAAADFTGDRKSDLLWQYPSTGVLLLWEMNGAAYVSSTILTSGGTYWRVVAAADFTGDGKTDILWQMPNTGAVLLWVMDGPTYVASIILNAGGTYWQVVGAADFTGDGQTDILWQHPSTGALLLWQMSGPNYVNSILIGQPGTLWRVVAIGDYTQDGQPDIVWQAPWDGSVLIWTMNGTSYVASTIVSGPTLWQVKGPR
jgi:hypothetical protein